MSDTSKGNNSKKSVQRPSKEKKSKEPIPGSSNEETLGTSQASQSAADRFAGGGAIRRTSNGRRNNGGPTSGRSSSRRKTSGGKTRDPLIQRRPLDPDDDYYNRRQCNCEKHECAPQSEYDVAGEWVTYTGEINLAVFQMASRSAAADLQRQMRAFTNPGATPRPRQPAEPTPSSNSGRPDQPFEIIDEWAAFSAEEAALQAMVAARRAVDQARDAKRKAGQAKLTGAPHARRLEKEARFAVQHARDLKEDAKTLFHNAERIAQLSSHDVATYDSEDDVEAEVVRALGERLAVRDASVNEEVAQE